ncbi:28S ribosomal protein S21, mitochondrial [Halotydeus destructor]|nr:28S ribosomal protein S21, mitochondrial [Halotydeus destructor]
MVEEAFRAVNKILGSEGLFDLWRRTRYYEKPFNTRRRVNYEKCKAIYDEDMKRKIAFVMKKNKADAWVGR